MSAEPITPDPGPGGTPVAGRSDRLHWFAGRVHEVLDELGDPHPFGLRPGEVGEAVAELERAAARLSGLALRLLAAADRDDLGAQTGAGTTPGWVRGLVPVAPRDARRRVRLARTLAQGHEAVEEALVAGGLLVEQAEVICAAVDALPVTIGVDLRRAAETHLLEQAAEFDAAELARLGQRILHVVAPDQADAVDAARLDREERDAARKTSLSWGRDGHGSVSGRFRLPNRYAAMLAAALDAFTNPAGTDPVPLTEASCHPGAQPGVAERAEDCAKCAAGPTPAERVARLSPVVRGEAFCRLLETLNVEQLPTTGGLAPTVVVTIPLTTLMGGLAAAAILGTDTLVSPGEARRLACAAGIIPAVLDGPGRVLDLGRRRRFATRAQILALRVQQHGVCAVEHCDRPAHACDAHHWRRAWADGGKTDLAGLALVCPRHHTAAHQPGMSLKPGRNGRFQLHRRT
jgi:hypothetical protein